MAAATPVPSRAPDAQDRLLLQALLADGRASHRDLAARTGISLATVNRRIRALEAAGTIRGYAARIAPEAVGWSLTAIVGLRIDKGHVRTVQQEIAADGRIFAVYDVTGEWDGIAIARLRDREDLDDLVKSTLSAAHIQRTNTMFVLKTVLEEGVVRLPTPPARPGRPGARAHPL